MAVRKYIFSTSPTEEKLAKSRTNGARKCIYSVNGDSYTGEWKDNKKHGRGIQTWKKSGLVYEGYWEDGKRCGSGVLYAVDKNDQRKKIYSGLWKDNKRDVITQPLIYGYGENWYRCDEFYEGEWSEDKRSGWGRQYYKDGSMYEGEWLHDKRWGNGMLRLPNENRYEGEWINDMKNGKGKFIFHSTNQVMEGIWIDGIPKQTVISDLEPRQMRTESNNPIPILKLKSPDRVWQKSAEANFQILREKYPGCFN
ncbi:unnamed protein product [Hymenolepis diminuta]|uniref:MORN repeat-containing protein 3 n=1 Tax=Hymenolepis diminuta TaxID=6216 RepID=A0A0R3SCT5_HYMDI|nr:unnamed protein product [Hymenolepis diminuta]